jgi:hypothetical protein
MYNMTQLQNVASIYQLVVFANDATTGILILMFNLALFFVLLIALKRYSFGSALTGASAVSFLVSLLFAFAKMLNPLWSLAFFIILAFSVFIGSIFD